MTEAPPVAAVVPSWNSVDLLPQCLASLRAQDVELEILVVDNGSSDGSVALLEREGVPHLALPENVGFARAMNIGAAAAQGKAILGLNVDTVVEPGALRELLSALEADSALGGVQPRILQLEVRRGSRDPSRARLYSAGQALTGDGRAVELGSGAAPSPRDLEPREVFGVCGAACLLRRELFDQLGGYDERYFSFYEDVDLNVRARIAGWRFEYVPEAVVWHLGSASWLAQAPQPSAWNARLVARNRIATQVKFMPLRALPRILAVEIGSLLRAARQKRLQATLRGKVEGLCLIPTMLRERKRLAREGDLARARRWLSRDVDASAPAPPEH